MARESRVSIVTNYLDQHPEAIEGAEAAAIDSEQAYGQYITHLATEALDWANEAGRTKAYRILKIYPSGTRIWTYRQSTMYRWEKELERQIEQRLGAG